MLKHGLACATLSQMLIFSFLHLSFYVNQFNCCLSKVLTHCDDIMKYLHPNTPQMTRISNQNPTKKPVEKQGQLRMTVWLGYTWPEVELLLNGAVGGVSGQFESVFDSLMPLLEQRWGVVLSLAGCRRAESRAWHVYYNTFQCGPVGPGLPKNLLYGPLHGGAYIPHALQYRWDVQNDWLEGSRKLSYDNDYYLDKFAFVLHHLEPGLS